MSTFFSNILIKSQKTPMSGVSIREPINLRIIPDIESGMVDIRL